MTTANLHLTKEEMMVLGGRIKNARKTNRLTQNEVTEKLNCSIGHLSAVENGKCMPSGDELVAFCKLYQKDISYFFDNILHSFRSGQNPVRTSWLSEYGYVSDETLSWNHRFLGTLLDEINCELEVRIDRKDQ